VPEVVPGGKFGNALVIDMLVGKYSDGLPLHRQKERYARLGLEIAVSTLVDQVTWVTDLLRPLWRAAIAECIGSKVMHLDATGLPVLDHDASGGKRLGTLWGYVGDNVAAYIYASTGKKLGQKPGELGPEDILALREGPTVADASNLFDASVYGQTYRGGSTTAIALDSRILILSTCSSISSSGEAVVQMAISECEGMSLVGS